MPAELSAEESAAATVLAYHERTKHRIERYAPGPDTLDWDAQPAPFRSYEGCQRIGLPLLGELPAAHPVAQAFARPFALGALGPAQPWTLASLGVVLQTALGVTAWKTIGPDRWAVRANPSSGNLHPVEAYVIASGQPFLEDGVYHYDPREHALELRARMRPLAPALYVAFSSVMWREAWKYGERAFRYCQLDTGHALGALRAAAAILGCEPVARGDLSTAGLAALLGIDRAQDRVTTRAAFTEREEPELLLQLSAPLPAAELPDPQTLEFLGRASLIDAHPFYRWPAIDEVASATRTAADSSTVPHHVAALSDKRASQVLLGRRSAQRFDIQHTLSLTEFLALLRPLLPSEPAAAGVELVLFVHRVQGLAPGLYALPRRGVASLPLLAALAKQHTPEPVAEAADLPLVRLCASDPKQLMRVARTLHCAQDIAASSCFAVGMLVELEPRVRAQPGAYRSLLREAGEVGQRLYLQAEAQGLRGTGIGCYFDDAVHELLGLLGTPFQSLYHFTVGRALEDVRIETGPAYPGRQTA